jgi:hypothetical protein
MAGHVLRILLTCASILLIYRPVDAQRVVDTSMTSVSAPCMLVFYGGPIHCYSSSQLHTAEAQAQGRLVSPIRAVQRVTALPLSQIIDIYSEGGPIIAVDYIFGGKKHASSGQLPGTSGRYLDVEEVFEHTDATAGARPFNVPGRKLSFDITSSLPRVVVGKVGKALLEAAK